MDQIIKLPEPQKELDYPLMKAFENRRTKRKWTDKKISLQDISNLLWSACGITVPEGKRNKSKRTAPSGCNSQTIGVYILIEDGAFKYDEKTNSLIPILNKDIREYIGTQKMMKNAPLGLVFVSDYSKLRGFVGKDDDRKWFIAGTETGYISQNIYLYCAASGFATAVLGLVKREELHAIMGLKEHEKIVYTQVVGKL